MNLKQKITLVAFEVDCYDRREASPARCIMSVSCSTVAV